MCNEKKIKPYRKGQNLSAKDFNTLVRRLEKLENLTTVYPFKLTETTNAFVLSHTNYTECIIFVLKDDLTPGGSAEAYFLNYDRNDDFFTQQTGTTFKVHDLYTRFRGKAGYKGICLSLLGGSPEKSHIIIDIEQKAEVILFQLADTLLHTDESQENCHVLKYFRGKDPSSKTDKITIWNPPAIQSGPYGYSTATSFVSSSTSAFGWVGLATYDPIEDKYWIIDLECVLSIISQLE